MQVTQPLNFIIKALNFNFFSLTNINEKTRKKASSINAKKFTLTTTQNWVILKGCKLALQSDTNYNNGNYISPPKKDLKAFSRNYTLTLFDNEGSEEDLHLNLFDGFENTQSYLNFMDSFFGNVDANDLVSMLNAWKMGNIGKHEKFNNNTKEALLHIKCLALVMLSTTDASFSIT